MNEEQIFLLLKTLSNISVSMAIIAQLQQENNELYKGFLKLHSEQCEMNKKQNEVIRESCLKAKEINEFQLDEIERIKYERLEKACE